jgi:GH15 family glucan-1,4-alpha-glucosidase
MVPLVGFLPPNDERVVRTVETIDRELSVDGFVSRYRHREELDGLPPGEGAFLLCSFWMVQALAMMGRKQEAAARFEKLLALRNDVGLLSEEYDPRAKRLLGNIPQAFSHTALINSAFQLSGADYQLA